MGIGDWGLGLYQNNYINDKFSLSTDNTGKFILTGGYNNMFHVIDTEQRLNTQIVIDDTNEKTKIGRASCRERV